MPPNYLLSASLLAKGPDKQDARQFIMLRNASQMWFNTRCWLPWNRACVLRSMLSQTIVICTPHSSACMQCTSWAEFCFTPDTHKREGQRNAYVASTYALEIHSAHFRWRECIQFGIYPPISHACKHLVPHICVQRKTTYMASRQSVHAIWHACSLRPTTVCTRAWTDDSRDKNLSTTRVYMQCDVETTRAWMSTHLAEDMPSHDAGILYHEHFCKNDTWI